MPDQTFFGLGLAPKLLDILQKHKFVTPTPIQEKAIPIAIQGKDIVGIAQTGTGKTLAFALPMLQRLSALNGAKGLVVLPTRELALQVDETYQKIGRSAGLRTAVLIGGASMSMQMKMLRNNPHVIIATPGRLIDHLQQGTVKLNTVKVLVLDEADRMFDMGFAPQIKRVMEALPKERQTMLFSATMPPEIAKMAAQYMQLPLRVEIARAGTTAEGVIQEMFMVSREDKMRLLDKLLAEYKGTVLVFSRTKHGAKKIAAAVRRMSHSASEIHSNRSLAQRKEALAGFKSGKYRVLVATDIAARGIDVTGIELVINFDLPDAAEDYVHRIGRTGRAGMAGRAISFATPDQKNDVRQIERLVRTQFSLIKPTELPAHRAPDPHAPPDRPERPMRRGGSGGRSSHSYPPRSSSSSSSSYGSRPRTGSSSSAPRSYGSRPSHGQSSSGRSASRPSQSGSTSSRPSRPSSSSAASRRNDRPKRGPKQYFYGSNW